MYVTGHPNMYVCSTFYKLGCGLNHLFALKYCYLIHSVVLIVVSSKRERTKAIIKKKSKRHVWSRLRILTSSISPVLA